MDIEDLKKKQDEEIKKIQQTGKIDKLEKLKKAEQEVLSRSKELREARSLPKPKKEKPPKESTPKPKTVSFSPSDVDEKGKGLNEKDKLIRKLIEIYKMRAALEPSIQIPTEKSFQKMTKRQLEDMIGSMSAKGMEKAVKKSIDLSLKPDVDDSDSESEGEEMTEEEYMEARDRFSFVATTANQCAAYYAEGWVGERFSLQGLSKKYKEKELVENLMDGWGEVYDEYSYLIEPWMNCFVKVAMVNAGAILTVRRKNIDLISQGGKPEESEPIKKDKELKAEEEKRRGPSVKASDIKNGVGIFALPERK